MNSTENLITFYRAIPQTIGPLRADRSALGTMPAIAFQYCEALRTASSFGWYVFPPMSFQLLWDGGDVFWSHEGRPQGQWEPLTSAQFPGFDEHFYAHAPEDIKRFPPPFLSRTFQQSGIVQVWSGLFARTAPGWSLLVRAPANLSRTKGYDYFEGVIETDRWFGPLFINLKLTETNRPLHVHLENPLFQVQPLLRQTYEEDAQRAWSVVDDLGAMSPEDWSGYRKTIVVPNSDLNRKPGSYAAETRKRAHSTKSSSDSDK